MVMMLLSLISRPTTVLVLSLLILVSCNTEKEAAFDDYGGWKAIQRKASGFFRVDTVAGRWMLITPDGHGYLALGANHTEKFLQDRTQSQEFLNRFDGNVEEASHFLHETYLDLGLNAGEAYPPYNDYLKRKMPYVAHVTYPTRSHFAHDIFHPVVQDSIYASTLAQCQPLSNDSLVLGIAFKDLPNWSSERVDFYRQLPASAPGKRQYVSFLKEEYQEDMRQFNEVYQTHLSSFDDLAAQTYWSFPLNETVARDDAKFMGMVADTLYTLLHKAVKTAAPHHLFFGERYQLRDTPDEVLRAVGKYVDVYLTQSLIRSPQRPPEWQVFQEDGYAHEYKLTSKPMIIIDWATPFSLEESYENEQGQIKREDQAAADMVKWLHQALDVPYIIGIFKCQLIGSHPNDRWFPEGKMKRTLLKDDGTYFENMSPAMADAHKEVLEKCYQEAAALIGN